MKNLLSTLSILLLIGCQTSEANKFSLTGTTNAIEDGTILYLETENEMLDSTTVENNAFYFNTKLSKTPVPLFLRTKDFSEFRGIWVVDNSMTLDASTSDFSNATVTGSDLERQSFENFQKMKDLPYDEMIAMEVENIENRPNSLLSVFGLSIYCKQLGKHKTKELFDNFSEENKQTEYGKSIANFIELYANPMTGEYFVDFEMNDQNGVARKLSDFSNKLTLLEFWASNCGPCRKENPNLVKTYEKYNPKGFEIFAVSQDIKRESWLKAIEKDQLPWPQVCDLKGRNNLAYVIYGINSIPDNFLIDQNGIIIDRDLRGEILNKRLEELLN